MRDASMDPSEIDRSFALEERTLIARAGRVLGYSMLAGSLVWWPFDAWLYEDHPHLRTAVFELRLGLIAIAVVGLLVLRLLGDQHRLLKPFLGLTMVFFMVSMGRACAALDARFFMAATALPLATIPLTIPRIERAILTVAFSVAYYASYRVFAPDADPDTLGNAAGLLAFTSVLSVVFGHVFYETLKKNHAQALLLDERAKKLEELLVRLRQNERALAESNDDLSRKVAERTADLRRLAERLEEAREEDRRHVAREIHDETGQLLTALRMELDLAVELAEEEELKESLTRMTGVLEQTLGATRALVAELRPRVLDDLGLGAAVEWFVGRFALRSRLHFAYHIEPPDLSASPAVSTATYRVLQESLTNVVRHARASRVDVSLTRRGGQVVLEVLDDGIGIAGATSPEAKSGGMGVIGMRERAEALGGSFVLEERPEGGARLCLRVPDPAPAREQEEAT